jgi:ABC-type multidrug transport system ATPase subunit
VTVFLTTHYLDEAEQSDDVRTIKGRRVVVAGTPAALKAQLLRPYLVVDAADRGRLAAELRGLGVAFEEGPRLRVELDGRGVHELLRAVQTPLTHVQTHDPTLEDASLAIAEEPAE